MPCLLIDVVLLNIGPVCTEGNSVISMHASNVILKKSYLILILNEDY